MNTTRGMLELTVSIIKPDLWEGGWCAQGMQCRLLRMMRACRQFFDRLKEIMTSGLVVVQVLCFARLVRRHRELIGSTRPCYADACSIRRRFGTSTAAALSSLSVVLALL